MTAWKVALLLLGLLLWYAAGAGGVLTSGDDFSYASAAVDLATGSSLVHRFESAVLATEYVELARQPGAYASKFPIGLPLLLAPSYWLGGYAALFWISPLACVLGVFSLYRLALQVTRVRSIALLAAGTLATLPPVVYAASTIGSDAPSLAALTLALWLHARELERPSVGGFALVCLACAVGVLVRNPNVLALAAIGVHELIVHRRSARAHLARWVVGAAIVLAFLGAQLATHVFIYGTPLGGYRRELEGATGFSLAYVPHHLPRYLLMLCAIPPLGLPAMLWMLRRHGREAHGILAMLAAVLALFVVLYGAWWAQPFDYRRAFIGGTRFLLPVLPIACLFLAMAVHEALRGIRVRRSAIALGVLAQLAASIALTGELRDYKARMRAHRDAVYAATSPDALVIGPGTWAKLFFPHDGAFAQRRYASTDARAYRSSAGQEMLQLVERALAAGTPVVVLGSEQATEGERETRAALAARYRLVPRLATRTPYVLRVDQVVPR